MPMAQMSRDRELVTREFTALATFTQVSAPDFFVLGRLLAEYQLLKKGHASVDQRVDQVDAGLSLEARLQGDMRKERPV